MRPVYRNDKGALLFKRCSHQYPIYAGRGHNNPSGRLIYNPKARNQHPAAAGKLADIMDRLRKG
jgi:hypothetical protein